LSAVIFIELHSWALSEPLFLFITLLGFLLFDKYVQNNTLTTLFILSIVLGLCILTRYVGIANMLTILLVILVIGKGSTKKKLFDFTIIAWVSITPVVIWTYRNYALTQTINNRNVGFYPPVQKNFINAFHTFFTWYLPEEAVIGFENFYFYLLAGLILGMFIAVLTYSFRKHARPFYMLRSIKNVHPLILVYICYAFIYTGVVFFSKTYIDPGTGMSDRIFSPDSIQDSEVVIAIFGASEGDAFYEKYAEYIEMIQSDQVVSVYGFRSER